MGYGTDELNDYWDDEDDEDYDTGPRPINLHGDRIEVLRLLNESRTRNAARKSTRSKC